MYIFVILTAYLIQIYVLLYTGLLDYVCVLFLFSGVPENYLWSISHHK